MPVLLKCDNCGKIEDSKCSGWLSEPTFGGIKVLCPKCLPADEDYKIESERKFLIETAASKAREEAVKKYTPEYVRQLRVERAKNVVIKFNAKPMS